MMRYQPLSEFLTEYTLRNDNNQYKPVAVGRYGIRTRDSIYSKELAKDYSKNKVIYKNTLTVGMGSVQIDIGILTEDIKYSVSPAYHTYEIHDINPTYLRYCLECRNQDMFTRFVKRGSRQGKSIDLKRWLTYTIPVFDKQEQAEIVSVLDRVSMQISNRHEQLELFEQLVKSRFIELFGDLKSNPFNWECKNILEVADIDTVMVNDYEKYADYPHIGIDSIEKNTGRLFGYRTIAEDGVISGKYLFTGKHIIYSKIRPNLNKVALPDFDGLCSADAYPILPKENVCLRIYLGYVMRSEFFLDYILPFSRRANMPKVNKEQLSGFALPVPPIELQQQFAAFVEQTDKSKFLVLKIVKTLFMWSEVLEKMR